MENQNSANNGDESNIPPLVTSSNQRRSRRSIIADIRLNMLQQLNEGPSSGSGQQRIIPRFIPVAPVNARPVRIVGIRRSDNRVYFNPNVGNISNTKRLTGHKRKRDIEKDEVLKSLSSKKCKIGTCVITCDNDVIIKTFCCKQDIGQRTLCRISFSDNPACPFCKSTKIKVDFPTRSRYITTVSSREGNLEFEFLPIVQSQIMVGYMDVLFGRSRNQNKLVNTIYNKIKFTNNYYYYICSLDEEHMDNVMRFGAEKKLDEFFANYFDERIEIMLKKMETKLKKKLKNDDNITINIILSTVRTTCQTDLKRKIIPKFKPALVDALFQKIKDKVQLYINENKKIVQTLLNDKSDELSTVSDNEIISDFNTPNNEDIES